MIFYADLHVHIGRSSRGKPVKITASKDLTVLNILEMCIKKGIDIVGIVDAASPEVLKDLNQYIENGILMPNSGGGLKYKEKITLILGSEVEIGAEDKGSPHILCFLKELKTMQIFSNILSNYTKNINLSSQRCNLKSIDLFNIVNELGGFVVPAHVFTPFKSYYGNTTDRLSYVFKEHFENIYAIELGLSADSDMADQIKELKTKTFLSNSDAHSLQKIGREFNVFDIKENNFEEILLALKMLSNRKIIKNYGLNPELGKYHRTYCLDCNHINSSEPPVYKCLNCGSENVVFGVKDRITEIKDQETMHPQFRSEYVYQIPLEFIPKIGKKTIEKLIKIFGSELYALHYADFNDLEKAIGTLNAMNIIKARNGGFKVMTGGGGIYGKIALK